MLLSARSAVVLAACVAASAVVAQTAAPADRCEGTFCDLYYGGPKAAAPPAPAGQPASTPLMAPSGGILGFFGGNATPASGAPTSGPSPHPAITIGGGGLAAMVRGEPAERCTGTLCDLYYGGPPPEQPDASASQETDVTTESAGAVSDDDVPPTRHRNTAAVGVQYEPPHCVAPAADPWRCYR